MTGWLSGPPADSDHLWAFARGAYLAPGRDRPPGRMPGRGDETAPAARSAAS